MKKPFRPFTPYSLGVLCGAIVIAATAVVFFRRNVYSLGGVVIGGIGLISCIVWSAIRGGTVIVEGTFMPLLKHEDGPATKCVGAGEYRADGADTLKGSYKIPDGATAYVDKNGNVSGVGWLDFLGIEELTDWRQLLSQKETGW